eukprot:XP_011664538.1 PREDICTED: slit homolog 1 protein-like [Strongylocentrotus purpuratus]
MGLNYFVWLRPRFFGGMQELKVLQVDRNRLSDINYDKETWTIDLVELNISQNRFTRISEYSFVGLYNLTLLDLRSNHRLASLDLGSFTGLDSIQTVYLSECNIVTFTPIKSSLSSLDVSANPIICNCDLKWFLVWLNGPIRLTNEEETSCSLASMSHSYKTIILLSTAAVQDRWFMLKFRTAMDHVSDTQTEFVVAVFLEDIPDDEMPFLARLYLRDGRPYLHWTEDVRGHEYFWDKLVKTLTINLRTNDLVPNE